VNGSELSGACAPLDERRERHEPMIAHLLENDIKKWAEDYLSMLVDGPPPLRSLLAGIRALFGVSSHQAHFAVR
jgi:trehalose-6-phosphate synthase